MVTQQKKSKMDGKQNKIGDAEVLSRVTQHLSREDLLLNKKQEILEITRRVILALNLVLTSDKEKAHRFFDVLVVAGSYLIECGCTRKEIEEELPLSEFTNFWPRVDALLRAVGKAKSAWRN